MTEWKHCVQSLPPFSNNGTCWLEFEAKCVSGVYRLLPKDHGLLSIFLLIITMTLVKFLKSHLLEIDNISPLSFRGREAVGVFYMKTIFLRTMGVWGRSCIQTAYKMCFIFWLIEKTVNSSHRSQAYILIPLAVDWPLSPTAELLLLSLACLLGKRSSPIPEHLLWEPGAHLLVLLSEGAVGCGREPCCSANCKAWVPFLCPVEFHPCRGCSRKCSP